MALLFPPHFKGTQLIPSERLSELRVSNGQPRYCEKEGKILGLHLADTTLTNNQLTQIVTENDCSDLEVLHIARNNLTELTLQLPKLKFLDARENKQLTYVDLSGCPNLEKVVLNRCAISSLLLPESLLKIAQLEVANNQLTNLSLHGSIPKLRFLDVSENQLTQLPPILADCKDDFYLLAVGNKFDDITRGILGDGKLSDEERRERLVTYLSQFKDPNKVVTIDTLKLIFLGNTQVGKTTLADLLLEKDEAKNGSTHGVNLFEHKLADTEVIGIDFGGQDYYHSIHFPLFNEQALYLLLWGNGQEDAFGTVLNAETGEEEAIYPLNYWLGAVEYYIRDSRKLKREEKIWKDTQLSLYLANNRHVKNGIPETFKDLNNRELKENFGVNEFIKICLDPENDQKRQRSKEAVLELIEEHRISRPQSEFYKNLRDSITQSRKEGKVVLSIDEFKKIHSATPLQDIIAALPLLSYSVACHYLDSTKIETDAPFNDELTSHFIVDLGKFTGWLYEILTIPDLREKQDGYFQREDAEGWLTSEYAKAHLNFMLGFMLHHKIIFEVKDEIGRYVVPQYLKSVVKYSGDYFYLEDFVAPIVKYEFESYFHSNVLAELIKQCYEYLLKEETGWKYRMWKNKVVIFDKRHGEKRHLCLEAQMPEEGTLSKPAISLSRHPNKPVSDDFVRKIMGIIETQIEFYQSTKLVRAPNGKYIPIEVVEEPTIDSRDKKISNQFVFENEVYYRGDFKLFLPNEKFLMKKVFISYSHSDESYKDELKRHFVSLINENLVSAFDDRELSMGGNWDLELKQKIDECDIMIALISVDFLNTGYIMNTEIPRAIEMGKTVVPIVVRPCDWTNTILGTYNGTLKGKVISLFEEQNHYYMPTFRSSSREERDMFWLQVVKEFRNKVFM